MMLRFCSLLIAASLLAIACGRDAPPSSLGEPAVEQVHDLYTCGMHPNVIQEGPGACPICGMDLTPVRDADTAPARTTRERSPGERNIEYWVAPMDPTYISDRPGKSPMGMDLVPVYEDEARGDAAPGTVSIDPRVVQNMGVRIEPARRQTVFRHLRSIGEVEVGEDRISVVNLRFSGWVEQIHVDKTGEPVDRGQPLFEIYSPDLVAAQEEFLLALRAQGPQSGLARSARRKLELLDLAQQDIASIARSGAVQRTLPIRSPRTGHVLEKQVVEGARVVAGQDLYQIGDLTRIWVRAEVYEFDAPWVEVGQPAHMELSYQQGRVLEGKVAYIYPTLNKVSRTLTIRMEFENPDMRLKPGMFATVRIQYRREDDVLAIPTEAILDSGTRKIVFIAVGDGHFEPREIVTGLTGDRRLTEVISGIEEGELIVASGQFLLDSESQLQEARHAMRDRLSARADSAAESHAEIHAEALFSCPMHPEIVSHEAGRCPVCGMALEETVAADEEHP
jgi:Cu(I)/Ag(I) efflux system membrane fusion protein